MVYQLYDWEIFGMRQRVVNCHLPKLKLYASSQGRKRVPHETGLYSSFAVIKIL